MSKPDLAEFFKYSKPKKKPCAIGFLISGGGAHLPTEEIEQLVAACAADPGIITSGSIQQWLAARKHEVTVPAITTHRKLTCTCRDD